MPFFSDGNIFTHVSYTVFLPAATSSGLGFGTFLVASNSDFNISGVPAAVRDAFPATPMPPDYSRMTNVT